MLVWAERARRHHRRRRAGERGGGRGAAPAADGGAAAPATIPLGPALGQCCGGSVTLVWERLEAAPPLARPLGPARGERRAPAAARRRRPRRLARRSEPAAPRPLWVWGAGHVGRALVAVLAPFPDRAITWIDLAPGLFPRRCRPASTVVPAAEPAALAPFAPADATT